MGCAEADCCLEVSAHAHAQFLQAVAGGDFPQQREMKRGFLVKGRDAHQAPERRAENVLAFGDEGIGGFGQDAAFLGFLAGVDLNEALRPAAAFAYFIGERAGKLRAVDGLNDIAEGNGTVHLISLQGADKMQHGIGKFVFQGRPFFFGLLDPVFTKHPVAGDQRLVGRRCRMGLGNRHQDNRIRGASGGLGGLGHAGSDGRKVFPDIGFLGHLSGRVVKRLRRRHRGGGQ